MMKIDITHLKELAGDINASKVIQASAERVSAKLQCLPLLKLEQNLEAALSLNSIVEAAHQVYTDVVLLGTGGSSLGAQVLYNLIDCPKLRFHFLDNIDPITFQQLWLKIDLKRTLFLVISKSGSTPETLMQALMVINYIQNSSEELVSRHMLFMSGPQISPLRRLSSKYQCRCLDLPDDIGGRFSVFSVSGMFPALLAGVDIVSLIKGAKHTLDDFAANPVLHSASQSMALVQKISERDNRSQNVFMSYIDRLEPLGRWWRQLWAESLGKNGKGSTPIQAMGTVDQHSQLQLYLDGPNDKVFSLLFHPLNEQLPAVSSELAASIGMDYFANQGMGELMQAEQLATFLSLKEKQRPLRIIRLTDISEQSIGALMMQFVLETILMADLSEINCFDQPAVELCKKHARLIMNNNIG